jgi:soluble lytic murein transglycosylase
VRISGTALVAIVLLTAAARADVDDDSEQNTDEAAPAPAPPAAAPPAPAAPVARPARQRDAKAPKSVAFQRDWLRPFFQSAAAEKAALAFRHEQWAAAEAGMAKVARSASGDEKMAAKYLVALAKASQGKWSEAAAMFEQLYKSYARLAPYHAYHAARCRLRGGDTQAALDWAAKVPAGTVLEAEAALIRLDGLRALGNWREAGEAAGDYLGRFPRGPRRNEVLFKQAEAREKQLGSPPADAGAELGDITALYRRVWAEGPLETWGDRAAERLEAIAGALPPYEAGLVRTRVAGEWVARGMVLFDRNRNQDSEAAFNSALGAAGLDPPLACKAHFHRAQSAWKQRQRQRAAPLYDEAEQACARAGNGDLHAKALYQGARSYAASGDRAAASARYARVEAEHPDHSYADDARLRTAEAALDGGDEAAAEKLLSEIPARYPKGDQLGEALWRLAFGSWRAEKYDDAARWLDENLKRIPHEEIWYAEGRALYWKGRIHDKKKEREKAVEMYTRAVREYPLSVYALLSMARLSEIAPPARAALVRELRKGAQPAAWTFAARPLFGEPGFRRAVDLGRMGQGSDARRELSRLGLETMGDKRAGPDNKREDEDLLWIAAVLLDRAGVWNAAHSIPRHTLTEYKRQYPRALGAAKWRVAYPRAFAHLVSKNAKASKIPEWLQLAIMREESAFSPRIESVANAVGLTQLLVKTAKRFSGGAQVNREALMDPVKNLEYGARYLGFLYARFSKAAPLTIASYNAGEGAVDRWLGERGSLAMDEFMETIPFDETRNYTKRVLASYFAYSWLYDEKNPVPTIPAMAKPK